MMKKILIMLIILCNILFASSPCFAQEATVDCNIYDISDYHGLKLYVPATNIVNFWWTGREYLWRNSSDDKEWIISTDLENWSSFDLTDGAELLNKHSTHAYSINYWGGKYVIFDTAYEKGGTLTDYASRSEEASIYPLVILDDNFNIVESIDFGEPITAVSYVNRKYYLQTQVYAKGSLYDDPVNNIYVSDDALSWQKEDSLTEVPLSNNTEYDLIFEGTRQNDEHYYSRGLSSVKNSAGTQIGIKFRGFSVTGVCAL